MSPNLTILLTMATPTVKGTAAQLESLQAIALSPLNCGARSTQGIAWTRQQKEWVPYLPTDDGDLVRAMALMLLPWALQQSWAPHLDVNQMVHCWGLLLRHFDNRPVGMLIHATKLVRNCVEDPKSDQHQIQKLRRSWFLLCDGYNGPSMLWRYSDWSCTISVCDLDPLKKTENPKSLDPLYDAWLDLGYLALPSLNGGASQKGRHLNLDVEWTQRMGGALNALPAERHADVLLRLLASSLPDATKMGVCKKAKAQGWLHPKVHTYLAAFLPENDQQRYQVLPWTEVRKKVTHEDAVQQNKAIAYLYCPSLVPNFELLVNENDWADRACVQRAVHAGKRVGTQLDTLEITNLVT